MYVCASGSGAQKTTLEKTKRASTVLLARSPLPPPPAPLSLVPPSVPPSRLPLSRLSLAHSPSPRTLTDADRRPAPAEWWLFVPVSKPTVATSSNSYANTVLLAAQADSIATREKKIAAQKAAFGRRSLDGSSGAALGAHEQGMVRRVRRHVLDKRGIKTVVGGTFYIIPTDHLLDRTAALVGKQVKRGGIKNTAIADWKKVRSLVRLARPSALALRVPETDSTRRPCAQGNKAQQWKVTRVN